MKYSIASNLNYCNFSLLTLISIALREQPKKKFTVKKLMVYDTLNFNFFQVNSIKFFSVLSVWTFSQNTVIRQDTGFTSRLGPLPALACRL